MYKTDTLKLQGWWEIPIEYHPTNSGIILINIPGAGGTVSGYKNKYVNLGNYLQSKNIASFVRIPNDRPSEYELTVRTVINYCLEKTGYICEAYHPEIWLMGFSAGAGAIVLTGWEYPEVKKILAINPFLEVRGVRDRLKENLPRFEGELYLVKGKDDTVIAPDTMEYISSLAKCTSVLKTLEIPDCDHQLKGEDNSKILSKLPEHFFLGEYRERECPNKEEGFNLLDEDLPLRG
ncbi:MAG TPA: hypothetical protein PLD77_01305 [Candidatus Dojkabacteria bacterium]|nr:hypothetical protein [Candidatus Dojkabacteria bacterium]